MRDLSRFAIFLAFFSTILGIGSFYMARRLTRGLAKGSPASWAIRGAFICFVLLQWVAPALYQNSRKVTSPGVLGLQWVAYFSLGLSAVLFFAVIIWDFASLVRRKTQPKQISGDRRLFMSNAVRLSVLGGAGVVAGVGAYQARRTPSVTEVDVPIQGLAPELEGFKIVQVSDLHVGQTIQREFVERVVAVCNSTQADLVALTGDLVDGHTDQLSTEVEPLRGLRSKYGTFYVPGNHEYFWGGSLWLTYFASLGFNVLGNAHRVVQVGDSTLLVSGVLDLMASRMEKGARLDAQAAVLGAPLEPDFHLMLAHQPRAVYECEKVNPDLQLSGHTHAGQFFPFAFFARLAHPYVKGLNRHKDKMWIYVNQGTGYWGPPNRFGVPSEITLLRLRSQSAAHLPS